MYYNAYILHTKNNIEGILLKYFFFVRSTFVKFKKGTLNNRIKCELVMFLPGIWLIETPTENLHNEQCHILTEYSGCDIKKACYTSLET